MNYFWLLELQKNIEERRLILGQKFEKFLLKKLTKIAEFLKKVLSAKSAVFFGSLLVVAVSILVRSTRDIGYNSGIILDLTSRFLSGENYQNFVSPLTLYITALPVLLAKYLSLSPIITSEIFVNSLGILAIYFAAGVLSRSNYFRERIIFNLTILSFAIGFFLPVFLLQFNGLVTSEMYFLAAFIPYLSYQFLDESDLKKSDQILLGFLAAFLFSLKPHYGIFVVIFELRKPSSSKGFFLRSFVTAALLIAYAFFFPEFFKPTKEYSITQNIIFGLREDFLLTFLPVFLCFSLIKKDRVLQLFFLTSLGAGILTILEPAADYRRFIFYSLSLPMSALLTFFVIKKNYTNWRRDFVILLAIFFVPQFEPTIFSRFILQLTFFWWVVVLFKGARNLKLLSVFLAVVTLILASSKKYDDLAWIVSSVISILVIIFYQKMHEKNLGKKEFSTLSTSLICLSWSYLVSLYSSAIFDFKDTAFHRYKSPNYLSDQLSKTVTKNSRVVAISNDPTLFYPLSNYLNLSGKFLTNSDELKQQISRKENELILVESDLSSRGRCEIGVLEKYFSDPDFRRIFLQNYVFLNRIIEVKQVEKSVKFFGEDELVGLPKNTEIIVRDVEVYKRKER